jgi:hypothetical protein
MLCMKANLDRKSALKKAKCLSILLAILAMIGIVASLFNNLS